MYSKMSFQMAQFAIGVIVTAIISQHPAAASVSAYDDCVINGVKGVSSDIAARLVAQSCKNKIAEAKKLKAAAFGSALSQDEFVYVSGKGSVQSHDDGYYSQVIKNRSPFKTITYVALNIKDGDYYDWKSKATINFFDPDILKWQADRSHTYFYKLTLTPESEVRLMFRNPRTDSFYAEVVTVLGREAKWSDKISTSSFSKNIKPELNDPLE